MRSRMFMPAFMLLLAAVIAQGQPQSPRRRLSPSVKMVLWYADSVRSGNGPTTVSGSIQVTAGMVNGALQTKGATGISIDSYFRRAIFLAPPESLAAIDSIPWKLSMMPWPEVIADNDNTRKKIRVDGLRLPVIGAGSNWQGTGPVATGDSVIVGIFDISQPLNAPTAFRDLRWIGAVDYPDKGRWHATHVAGIVAGVGIGGGGLHRGMAPGALLRSWSIFDQNGKFNSSPDPVVAAKDYMTASTLHIAQNSWTIRPSKDNSCIEFGAYNGFCADYDKLVREKNLTVVFSAGNHRCTCYEALCGGGGYHMVMAPATAKNIITVGAVDPSGTVATFSSFGGTADNRIVPSIVAPGVNIISSVPKTDLPTEDHVVFKALSGTSMAAPAVSGGLALLVQVFQQRNGGLTPAPALLKALLLNNATDLGVSGPDMIYGYGLADFGAASNAIVDGRHAGGSLFNGSTAQHTITVAAGCTLKVMLCYSDAEGDPGTNTGPALVNDLDLKLVSPNGDTLLPLKLDPAHITYPAQPGVIGNDNTEQVVALNPAAGTWRIVVKGTFVKGTQPQPYAVTWTRACPITGMSATTTTGASSSRR